ncbi:MAG: BlaI/MecI/CopY family transcriptional regulator [Enterobacterales bacterium]|nr:BlaI/MecI/CopY family transcriptional regulator [Enterobacterales bacterium]
MMELSDFELEVMQLFWSMDESTAPEVHKVITSNRNGSSKNSVTYSTVKTIS